MKLIRNQINTSLVFKFLPSGAAADQTSMLNSTAETCSAGVTIDQNTRYSLSAPFSDQQTRSMNTDPVMPLSSSTSQ